MREIPCPCCGASFVAHYGVDGAPADGMRGERYCSEWCRDRAAELENRRSAARASRWKAPDSFPWSGDDPFGE